MNTELYETIQKSKDGNDEATLEIINDFMPLIKKYSRKLKYDTASSDLIISMICIIRNMPIHKKNLKDDRSIVAYITSSIKNQYIKLSKKHQYLYKEIPQEDIVIFGKSNEDIENGIVLDDVMDKLSNKEKLIVICIFFYGYTESELAKKMKVSRQAVNKTKKKALKKLKKYLCA